MPRRRSCPEYAIGVAYPVRFVETPIFSEQITECLSDEDYRRLQVALALRPEQGSVMRGSGGLRKIRWSTAGRGKRGGLRVIYFWERPSGTCLMLYAYTKTAQGDLTPAQIKVLRQVVKEEFR